MPTALQLLYVANENLTGNLLQLRTHPKFELQLMDLPYNNLWGFTQEYMPLALSVRNIFDNALAGTLLSKIPTRLARHGRAEA